MFILKIIARRIKTKIDKELNEVQAGFRPGTGVRNQIFNLEIVVGGNREYGSNLLRKSF